NFLLKSMKILVYLRKSICFLYIKLTRMLFDFIAFINELRDNNEKKETIEKYEKLVGPIEGGVKDQVWFVEYLANFKPTKYLVPEELQKDFDRDLLQQLVLGSFSSDYELKTESEKEPELYIAVKSGDQSVVKKVSELWSFQIQRLYEIYIEEQINLQVLKAEDQDGVEKNSIEQERLMRQKRRQAVLDTMGIKEEAEKAKVEQSKSLDELMGKL
ncbi:MAG TPA: hypothetical protein P5155_01955, partial [Candidatus Absconditabacterales bacterium]|nr:hypothetical protein [Candidatus Absconditabacterales bacterium]